MPSNGISQNGNGQAGQDTYLVLRIGHPRLRVIKDRHKEDNKEDKKRKKKEKEKKKEKKKKKGEKGERSGTATPIGGASARPSLDIQTNGLNGTTNGVNGGAAAEPATSVPPTPGAEQLDPTTKKVRNLNKKMSVACFASLFINVT